MDQTLMDEQQPYESWEEKARELLISVMEHKGMSYKGLALRLEELGIRESADQINRKVNRRKFPAAFLLACLAAMDVEPDLISDGDADTVSR